MDLKQAVKKLRVEKAWQEGWTGKGVRVAVLDTGIAKHPDLTGRLITFQDFVNGAVGAYDDYGHGTHVSGILCGEGNIQKEYRGIAPQADLISVKVLDKNGNGRREQVISGIRWVIQHNREYGIRIMNISVGSVKEGNEQDQRLIESVEQAWDSGIVVVCAAGNLGPEPYTITAPGNSRKVITVGMAEDRHNWYSGCGPTYACVCKPDLVAPGSQIWSCNAFYSGRAGISGHSCSDSSCYSGRSRKFYCQKSGTSMATPMISGAIALLLEKEPWLTNVEVKMRLKEAAKDLGMERNRQGWGQPDIPTLLNL